MMTERTRELWIRFLENGELSFTEERELSEALLNDEGLKRELLTDIEIDGFLHAIGVHSHEEEEFTRSFFERLSAECDGSRFIKKVESKIEEDGKVAGATNTARTGPQGGTLPARGGPQTPAKRSAPSTRRFTRRQVSEQHPSWWVPTLVAAGVLVAVLVFFTSSSSGPDPASGHRAKDARARASRELELRKQSEAESLERERARTEAETKRREAEAHLREIEEKRRVLTQAKPEPLEAPLVREKREKEIGELKHDQERIEQELKDAARLAKRTDPPALAEPSQKEKPSSPPAAPTIKQEGTTQAALARLEEVAGEAFLVTKEGKSALASGANILGQHGLLTGGGVSRIVLRFPDKTRVDLGADTRLTDVNADAGMRLSLTQGTLRAVVAKQPKDQPMVITTPHGQAKVVGTTLRLYVDPDPNKKGTRLEVEEGKVELKNLSGKTVLVESGHYAVAALSIECVARPVRAKEGLQALYFFDEGRGTTVHDVSGIAPALDLEVEDVSAIRWLPERLEVRSSTLIASVGQATKIIQACKNTNELTVEAWIRPGNATQNGPARIVSLSVDTGSRNFTLAQGGDTPSPQAAYSLRLRTTPDTLNGTPALGVPELMNTKLSHVVFTRDASAIERGYVDGVMRVIATRPGTLSDWDETYRLALANEFTHDRTWLGEFYLVAIYNRALSPEEVLQNFQVRLFQAKKNR